MRQKRPDDGASASCYTASLPSGVRLMPEARPKLITFAASHFCEKGRWALDWHGIAYDEVGWPPGVHQILARRSAAAGEANTSLPTPKLGH